jgi:hypothetical protein
MPWSLGLEIPISSALSRKCTRPSHAIICEPVKPTKSFLAFFNELLKEAGISFRSDRLDLIRHLRAKQPCVLVDTAETVVTSETDVDFAIVTCPRGRTYVYPDPTDVWLTRKLTILATLRVLLLVVTEN